MSFLLQLYEFTLISELDSDLGLGKPNFQHGPAQILVIEAGFSLLELFVQIDYGPDGVFRVEVGVFQNHFSEKGVITLHSQRIINDGRLLFLLNQRADLVLGLVLGDFGGIDVGVFFVDQVGFPITQH